MKLKVISDLDESGSAAARAWTARDASATPSRVIALEPLADHTMWSCSTTARRGQSRRREARTGLPPPLLIVLPVSSGHARDLDRLDLHLLRLGSAPQASASTVTV